MGSPGGGSAVSATAGSPGSTPGARSSPSAARPSLRARAEQPGGGVRVESIAPVQPAGLVAEREDGPAKRRCLRPGPAPVLVDLDEQGAHVRDRRFEPAFGRLHARFLQPARGFAKYT